MIGFHIDMNMAHYSADYLRTWLRELARLGYDTVIWEVENSIQWETCPECVAPDAFTKNEFRALLAECRLLGLEPIPLLQTLGHCEYVLKHEQYADLRELPGHVDQYCPRNPQLIPFLHRWIDEYLGLFGPLKHFHIGNDETMCLGCCPICKAYADEHSLSKLYVEHVNAVARPLIKRGITPIIWADMVLARGDALEELTRDIMLFDWRYDTYRGLGKVCIWDRVLKREGDSYTFGEPMCRPEDLSADEKARYGAQIFPQGENGPVDEFYTADYLAANGFRVVTCPSSSHYGDNCFSPRHALHTANVFDSFVKSSSRHLHGSVLTSWSVHLFPWELQQAYITIPQYLRGNPNGTVAGFLQRFSRDRFGAEQPEFWQMCELLSGSCCFTATPTLGHNKTCPQVPADHAATVIRGLVERGELEQQEQIAFQRKAEYEKAAALVRSLESKVQRGHELLKAWKLAARNLVCRADTTLFLFRFHEAVLAGEKLEGQEAQQARILLGKLRGLRRDTDELYDTMIRPSRKRLMIDYLFGAVERAVAGLSGDSS